MFKSVKGVFTAITMFLLLPNFVFGAGGLDKVNSLMSSISNALYVVGVVVLTIAIMWAGFKIMFQGQTLREVAPPLLGGILVGAASGIAGLLIS